MNKAVEKVLMIEDEKDLLSYFYRAFEDYKEIQFLTSLTAQEGIEIAKRERPKVVMLDLRMPGINGEQALAELKAFLRDTKFVVMTAYDDEDTERRISEEIGVDLYLQKPVKLEDRLQK